MSRLRVNNLSLTFSVLRLVLDYLILCLNHLIRYIGWRVGILSSDGIHIH